jgi:hypothetical protein
MEQNGEKEMSLTENEEKQLNDVFQIINNLKNYLNENNLYQTDQIKNTYKYIIGIKNIQGNINDSISFISCLLAKNYLENIFKFKNFDVAIKSQSAPGLDIDEITEDGQRIIGEIKTTDPCKNNDFGANQIKSLRNDFEKLRKANANYKYLFVTEKKAFEIIHNKYLQELANVEVILL